MKETYIYRYRPTKSILGEFQELEKQEIYFASINELNDPMEGYIMPFYMGTDIHWTLLIKCLFSTAVSVYLNTEYANLYFPQSEYSRSMESLINQYDVHKIVLQLADAKNHYNNEQVKMLLQNWLTPYVTYHVAYHIENFFGNKNGKVQEFKELLEKARKCLADLHEIHVDKLMRPNDYALEAVEYLNKYINNSWINFYYTGPEKTDAITEILYNATTKTLHEFDKQLRMRFRVASFSENGNNCSMWGNYSSAQNGVCLKFSVIYPNNKPTLRFIGDFVNELYLEKVKYVDTIANRDTAYNILSFVNLNMNQDYAKIEMYSREPYLQKFSDWKYEKEWRLLIPDKNGQSKVRYDFSALQGIIFGINVSFEDRRKIIDIIGQKCNKHNRIDFDFYEFNPNLNEFETNNNDTNDMRYIRKIGSICDLHD